MEEKIAALEKEILAIKTREAWYVDQERWEEMIPWFDLTDHERKQAIAYWGEK